MAFSTQQSFEPRVGTAQLVFGVIYTFIMLIALCMAFYAMQEGRDYYLSLFMGVLFALLAAKSFFISARVKKLVREGVYMEAQVDSCEPVRGITVIKGVCDVPNYGLIHIETRLVGESICHEIKTFMADHKQFKLPALVVGANTNRPRGMFTVKGDHGHLVVKSAMLRGQTAEDLEAQKQSNSALDDATARAKAATRLAEEQKQQEAAQAQAEQAQAEQADTADTANSAAEATVAMATQPDSVVGDKRQSAEDAALMTALKQQEQKQNHEQGKHD